MQTSSARKTAACEDDLLFEAFIQFKEYVGFVKAMNAMRGMKLLYKDPNTKRNLTSFIDADFDKTKHLSDKNVRKRRVERKRLQEEEEERAKKKQREMEEEIERRKEIKYKF